MSELLQIEGIPSYLQAWIQRLVHRSLDGIVIVDDKFRILLANEVIVRDFAQKGQNLVGTNYFQTMFGWEPDPFENKDTPMYRAIRTGLAAQTSWLTTEVVNGILYQTETLMVPSEDANNPTRVMLEFWRRWGNSEI